MEIQLQFIVFLLLIPVSLGMRQRVTVMKGETVILNCSVTNPHQTHVEWKNPEGQIMFFNKNKALKDKRYSIIKLSQSEFSISISSITFKDGGNYTCSQYHQNPIETIVEVTVLGFPTMSVAKHDGKNVIKCSAEGNNSPPQISWELDHEPEFLGQGLNFYQVNKKYISKEFLQVYPVKNRVTVKCIVRHPRLHMRTLIHFVKIEPATHEPTSTIPPRLATVDPHGSTEDLGLTSSWPSSAKPTAFTSNPTLSATELKDNKTGIPLTSTDSHPNTTGLLNSTWNKESIHQTTNTTDETTQDITFYNTTGRNLTEISGLDQQIGAERNSHLLVLLVTSLIFGLLVVVIFFAIKLRRAHLAWKRENEESDPSEESSKSKSSQEDKNSQGHRRRGLFSTAFTQYVVEEPTGITSVVNTNALAPKEQMSSSQTPVKCDIKETSL
ncbi:cytotoxic and regulatory T-cell molecule [Kryptolebias marmoratus]|uniref:Cytotoxic and regulatory T cell molecule n=1 Tax=Kryptolebias marmoratus TaxID=37003 RepID=A0A3Q3BB17_KRYMA|nr:cytotoxic and regulatory T-cell molecule [Kryptolebias marmoratus]